MSMRAQPRCRSATGEPARRGSAPIAMFSIARNLPEGEFQPEVTWWWDGPFGPSLHRRVRGWLRVDVDGAGVGPWLETVSCEADGIAESLVCRLGVRRFRQTSAQRRDPRTRKTPVMPASAWNCTWQWYIHRPGPTPSPAMTWKPNESAGPTVLVSSTAVSES